MLTLTYEIDRLPDPDQRHLGSRLMFIAEKMPIYSETKIVVTCKPRNRDIVTSTIQRYLTLHRVEFKETINDA